MMQLKLAIEGSQSLAPYKDQLPIDITPEGLRVQIIDKQNRPMFDSGSFKLQPYTNEILDELAEYLASVPNRVAIAGHTDVSAFGNGDAGYTNRELSADRANAARHSLISGELPAEKFAHVVGLASSALFDKEDPSNPVHRRISIILLSHAAEEQTRKYDGFDHADGDSHQDDTAAVGNAEAARRGDGRSAVRSAASASSAVPATPATANRRDAGDSAARSAARLAELTDVAAAQAAAKRRDPARSAPGFDPRPIQPRLATRALRCIRSEVPEGASEQVPRLPRASTSIARGFLRRARA